MTASQLETHPDLTTTPVRSGPLLKDVTLEHQFDVQFVKKDRNFVQARCNCGWLGVHRRPDVPEPTLNTLGMKAEYEGHLAQP